MRRPWIATLVLVGCSNAPSNNGDDPAPVDPRPIVESLAQVQCEKMFDCCTQAELETLFAGQIGDVDACTAALRTQADAFLIPALEAAQSEGRATLDDASVSDCSAAVAATACDAFESATSLTLLDGVCPGVVEPKLTLSAFCAEDFECDTGFCSVPSGEAEGACKNPPEEGEPCLNDRCGDGLHCRPDGRCAPLLDEGDGCGRNADCVSGVCEPGEGGETSCAAPTNACAG